MGDAEVSVGPALPPKAAENALFMIGRYRVLAGLGRGGMADVFLAVTEGPMGFNKLVVLKRMRADAGDTEFVAMFLDEAKIAARLNHANIVHTYEVGEDSGVYFMAMEYLEGQPLDRVLSRVKEANTNVSPAIWTKIVEGALAGLHFAHEARDYDGTPLSIVHRDISPQNIFVTYDGEVKIVDFGIAKAALSSIHTDDGLLKGKVHYMAPEHALGLSIDRRSDVFSAGMVLWELLAGTRALPASGTAAYAVLTSGSIRKLSEVAKAVSPDLSAIVERAVERDAHARFASADEFREALVAHSESCFDSASTQDIAAMMAAHFEPQRRAMQHRVAEYLSGKGEELTKSDTTLRFSLAINRNHGIRTLSNLARDDLRMPPRRISSLLIIVVSSLVIAGFAFFFQMRSGEKTTTIPPSAAPTSEASEVQVIISVRPSNAKLAIDGVSSTENPLVIRVAKDGSRSHDVRAEAEGFFPSVRLVKFDSDTRVEIVLERMPLEPVRVLSSASTASSAPPKPYTPPGPLPAAKATDDRPPFQLRIER